MLSFPEKNNINITNVYTIIDRKDLELLKGHQFKSFPKRFYMNKHLHFFLSKDQVEKIFWERNNWSSKLQEIFLVRFVCHKHLVENLINNQMMIFSKASEQELNFLNNSIIGLLEVVERLSL